MSWTDDRVEKLSKLWADQGWPRRKMSRKHWLTLSGKILGEGNSRADMPGDIDFEVTDDVVRIIIRSA